MVKLVADEQRSSIEFIELWESLAEICLSVPVDYFGSDLLVERKLDMTPVSEADKSVELALRELIVGHYPEHGIIGEEFGSHARDSEYQWIIDPIDGTKSFICGFPMYGSLVGLLCDGEPIGGLMVMPSLGEVFFGVSSGDLSCAWKAGVEIKVSGDISDLSACRISLGEGNKFSMSYPMLVVDLADEVDMVRFYHDCYPYGLLASGFLHGVLEFDLQIYDFLPLVPIIKGGGGIVSDWRGGAIGLGSDGSIVASANRYVHDSLLLFLGNYLADG